MIHFIKFFMQLICTIVVLKVIFLLPHWSQYIEIAIFNTFRIDNKFLKLQLNDI